MHWDRSMIWSILSALCLLGLTHHPHMLQVLISKWKEYRLTTRKSEYNSGETLFCGYLFLLAHYSFLTNDIIIILCTHVTNNICNCHVKVLIFQFISYFYTVFYIILCWRIWHIFQFTLMIKNAGPRIDSDPIKAFKQLVDSLSLSVWDHDAFRSNWLLKAKIW